MLFLDLKSGKILQQIVLYKKKKKEKIKHINIPWYKIHERDVLIYVFLIFYHIRNNADIDDMLHILDMNIVVHELVLFYKMNI